MQGWLIGKGDAVMKITNQPMELPYAIAHRAGYERYEGEGPGLYFYYYRTRQEAEKVRRALKRKGKFAGRVEYRPDECRQLGFVSF